MLIIPYSLCIFYILHIKKTQKYTWVLAATVMAFLSVTSDAYADLDNYIPLFEYVNSIELLAAAQTTGIGWVLLNKLFYMLGLNYRGMVVGVLYINYYLMHIAVKRLKANENLYFGMFLVFPALIQLVQLKFFTAFCIVFAGYSLLVTAERFSRVKYIAFIVIASLVHTSSFIFLILLLVKTKRYDRKLFVLLTIGLVFFVVVLLDPIVRIASLYLDPRLVSRYLTDSITPSSFFWIVQIFAVWMAAFLISTYLLSNKTFRRTINRSGNGLSRVADCCGMSIEVLLLTLPFLLLDRNFHRFLELGYSVLFVIMGMYISPPKYSRSKLLFMMATTVIFAVVTLIYSPYATVLKPLLSFEGFVNLRR